MAKFENPFTRKQQDISDALNNAKPVVDNEGNSAEKPIERPQNNRPTLPDRMSLPTNSHRQQINQLTSKPQDMFDDFLNDDDEEIMIEKARATNSLTSIKKTQEEEEDPILAMIERKIKNLKRKYPTGGIKTSRYIDLEVLQAASADYFDKFEEDIKTGSNFVKLQLGESDRSSIIRAAQNHPTDDAHQDKAYYVVSTFASEYIDQTTWRETNRKILQAMIVNEIIGFGRLDPLWRDRRIDEIICNGPYDIQIEISGSLQSVPSCKFRDSDHLLELIQRLYGAINKTITQREPLVKGRLHDKSRMYAVHPVISPDGPNFNIRRHPEGFWTPQELINAGSAPVELMKYLGNLIYKGASIVVVGGTSSGKTSLLNSLTGFYSDNVRILTLEDNLEMKPNPKKRLASPMEVRQSTSDSDTGTSMRDLVKASLQMRPDVLIIGEVTDSAAYDLAQALNTGHTGASTIHANTAADAIPRISSLISQSGLTTTIGALDMISAAFDVIVVTKHLIDGSRKIVAIEEVGKNPIDINGRLTLETIPLWRFVENGLDENRKVVGHWEQVNDLSQERIDSKLLGIQEDLAWEELRELSSLPEGYITHSRLIDDEE